MGTLTDRFRRFKSRFELTELLAAIVDASDDAIITTTLDGVVVAWSAGAEKVYQYTAEEMTGQSMSVLVPETRKHELTYVFNRVRHGYPVERFETERVRKDGQLIKVSLTWRPLRNRDQQLIGASLVVRDLSARKEAEEARQKAENEFRTVFDNAAVGIVMLDAAGQVIRCNPVFQMMIGYSEAELRSLSIGDLTHPEDRDKDTHLVRELMEGLRETFQVEKRYIRSDGRVVWVRVTASVARTEGGSEPFRVGVVQDITAQKLAEELARDSQQRLSLVLEHSPLAIVSWDLEFRVTEWNRAAEKMFGYSKEEALGQHFSFIVPDHARAHVNGVLQALYRRTGASESINENVTKDGRIIRCEWYNEILVDAAGKLIGLASIGHDVTAQHEMEDRLRHAQKMEAVGQLAGGIAHDFNNLLNVILGHAALLQAGSRGRGSAMEHSSQIQKAAERAATLTRQLLAFSRKQVLQPEVLDLREVVQGMSRMLERVIGEDISVEIVTGEEESYIRADRGQIEQVIMNLAVNARDAMPGGGRLTISAKTAAVSAQEAQRRSMPPGEYAVLTITDTGTGMDEATKAHIFEPFFTTKDVGKGTGLGLSTVHGVVAQSGGNIFVDTVLGGGTTFTIYLPRVCEAMPVANVERAEQSVLHGSETVLVAEDESALRTLMRQILEAQGYKVLEAADGSEAISISEAHPHAIELLISDMVMPGMRGFELAERIRAQRPSVRVLFVSGYAETSISEEQLADGAVSLLEKPFSPDVLLAKISEMLHPVRLPKAG